MVITTIDNSLFDTKMEGICYNGEDVKVKLILKNMVLVV
jgi:hypothetical protein